ncbi:hypothetical protein B6N60_02529 [Richelia sinica FACHB-800]|uniref:Uncharacterized protein n=1 Tax=Richelia sinica FACHB-800 TaxID=1357546 RepID=A0A975T7W2_9NOST|nr:hypothetical protein B6N60_02529 [Richelia sinica FACHB-800]
MEKSFLFASLHEVKIIPNNAQNFMSKNYSGFPGQPTID